MSGNGKSGGPLPDALVELLSDPRPSDDEVRASARFCAEAVYILLRPHENRVAERHGLMRLIACTSNYLKEMGAGRDELDRLGAYSAALGDLDDGVVHPMFKTNNGNPALGSHLWRLRGMCAVALDHLVGAKEPLDDAAKRLARMDGFEKLQSGRSNPKTGEKPSPFKSVKTWRKNASRGKDSAGNDRDETFRMVWEARQLPGSVDPLEFPRLAARQMDKIRKELRTLQADL